MIPDAPWRVVILTQIQPVAKGYAEIVRALGHQQVAQVSVRPRPERLAVSDTREFASKLLFESPADVDLVYPAAKDRLAPILRWYEPDLLLCTGFPWRIPADALAVPRIACVNGHPSLLPSYRGPTPVAWAIRNGETEVGMTYHLMDEQFDTGPILAQGTAPLADDETWQSLEPKLRELSAELLPRVFERLARGERGEPQDDGSYQSLFGEDYLFVDSGRTALEVHTQVRAWRFSAPGLTGEQGPILERDGARVRLVRTSLAEVDGAERLDCADAPLWIVETEPAE